MELAERVTGRVTELTSEVELVRKQLADAEHELDLSRSKIGFDC